MQDIISFPGLQVVALLPRGQVPGARRQVPGAHKPHNQHQLHEVAIRRMKKRGRKQSTKETNKVKTSQRKKEFMLIDQNVQRLLLSL